MSISNSLAGFTVVATLVLASSCSQSTTLTYKVKNMASDSIDVIHAHAKANGRNDTTQIGYNQEVTIAINNEGSGHVSKYKQTEATLRGFTKLEIYRDHTQLSKTSFLETRLWNYKESGRHSADYIVTVTDSDF